MFRSRRLPSSIHSLSDVNERDCETCRCFTLDRAGCLIDVKRLQLFLALVMQLWRLQAGVCSISSLHNHMAEANRICSESKREAVYSLSIAQLAPRARAGPVDQLWLSLKLQGLSPSSAEGLLHSHRPVTLRKLSVIHKLPITF